MAEVSCGRFDPAFVPNQRFVNALFGLLVGETEGPSWNSSGECRIDVWYDWISKNVPNPNDTALLLMAKGFAVQVVWWSDDSESFGLTADADWWLHEHHGLPLQGDEEDEDAYLDRRAAWVAENITPKFKRKAVRAPGAQRAKPIGLMVARSVSHFVPKTSFTQEEAAQAHAAIQDAYDRGNLTERQQAGYKAVVTRRIAA